MHQGRPSMVQKTQIKMLKASQYCNYLWPNSQLLSCVTVINYVFLKKKKRKGVRRPHPRLIASEVVAEQDSQAMHKKV